MQLVQGEAERVVTRVLDKIWTNVPKPERVNLGDDAFTAWLTVYETKDLSAEDKKKFPSESYIVNTVLLVGGCRQRDEYSM